MNILNDQTYRNSINTNKNKNYLKDCLNTYTSIHSSFFKLIISYCSVIRLECITNSTFRMSKKHKNIVEIQVCHIVLDFRRYNIIKGRIWGKTSRKKITY